MIVRRAEADSIGTEAEKRRLRQIDLPTQAEHDREAEHRDRKRGRLHQDVVDVAVELHGGDEGNEDRGANEIWQVTQQQRFCARGGYSYRHVVAADAHAFSATRSPKMP